MNWPHEIAERDHVIQDPTSPDKIRRVGEYLRLDASSHVLDLGCGMAGPAIILAREFGCRIDGVEVRPAFADEARRRVTDAGLDDRITIVTADARTLEPCDRVDVVLCLGAAFIWGDIGAAAAACRTRVRDGGHVVIGEPFWRRRPLPAGVEAQEWVDLRGTIERFEGAGLRLVGFVASSEEEWDHYESLHWRAIGEWLDEHPDDPMSAEVRVLGEQFREEYLRRRGLLGWAMFVGRT
jgi:SAM-dependent methyltransferase